MSESRGSFAIRKDSLNRKMSVQFRDFMSSEDREKMKARSESYPEFAPTRARTHSDINDFEEFNVLELEEARSRQKDPSSRTRRICCKLCILGPSDQQGTPIIAIGLTLIAAMLVHLLTFIVYENAQAWQTLGFVTCGFSLTTLLLMFVVMCSDPGIQTRDKLLQLSAEYEKIDSENALAHTSTSLDELPDLGELGFNAYEIKAI